MIVSNDIRIGNKLLSANCDNVVTVEEIKWKSARVNYVRLDTKQPNVSLVEYDWLNGLPINGELLEIIGFGFNRADFSYGIVDEEEGSAFFIEPHAESFEKCTVWYGNFPEKTSIVLCYIQYLHQLQNVYYTVTGKELKLSHIAEHDILQTANVAKSAKLQT